MQNSFNRVVITDMGIISPIGLTAQDFWDSLLDEKQGITAVDDETAAIKDVLGEHAHKIPVVSNKGSFGHSIAGSGALELIGCVLSLNQQVVPPTINHTTPDPECDLDYVTEGKRPLALKHVMSNSFAFGGSTAALIVSRYQLQNN